jgi:hypothetical protein
MYSSPNIIRTVKSGRKRRAGLVSCIEKKRNAHRILVGESEGKRALGRPSRRWENNIKIKPREIGWVSMNWIDWTQDIGQWRVLVNTMINLRVP